MQDKLIKKIILMVGIIAVLGVASSSVVIASPAYAQAQPTHVVIEKFNQSDVPPGLTRVTIIHGIDETRTEIDHGPGVVPPPKKQESFACTNPDPDFCDTNSFNGKKWFSLPLSYSVNLKDASDAENFLAAVNAGIQTWEDDPDSSFVADFLGETGKKASTTQPRARMDGSNVVDWGSTNHFGGTVIAVVVYFYFTATGEMVEADMRFNEDLPWSSSTTGLSGFFDVQNIATHEGGHFVAGLRDLTDDTESELTMYGFASTGEVKKRTLGLGDKLSIATAYPGITTPQDPTISIDDVSLIEGDAELTAFTFTATRGDDTDAISVDFATSDGTATIADNDYQAAGGTLTFTAGGSLTKTITVQVVGDTNVEPDETFFVNLSNCVGCLIIDNQGQGTITKDDNAPPGTGITDIIFKTKVKGKNNDLLTTVYVADSDGNVVSNALVQLTLSRIGASWDLEGVTNEKGEVTFTLMKARSETEYKADIQNKSDFGASGQLTSCVKILKQQAEEQACSI